MIAPGADLKVYVATRPVDFRKGHDGLAALVQQMFGLDPFSGALRLASALKSAVCDDGRGKA
jgi:transposase